MTEHRTFTDIEIRAVDDGVPGVTLQAIKPGVVDDYGSLWRADTFDESLSQRLPVLCWAHDWADPLGPGVSYETTRSGPKIRFNFSNFDAVPQARRAHAQVMDGTIRDCSVGFSDIQRRDPTDAERAKHGEKLREVIERASLDEVSLVLRGAVPGAKVLAVRSVRTGDGQVVDIEAAVEIARKVASGELTHDVGAATLKLLSSGSQGSEAGTGGAQGEGEPPEPVANETLDAEIDAALASIE